MGFSIIENRLSPPIPWSLDLKFPWDEPGFSDRMLKEHLYQGHDKASHRQTLIRAEIDWIHNELLRNRAAKILDLCCGPGFYVEGLNSLGHDGHGVDFSPSAITYARAVSKRNGSKSRFDLADVRTAGITDTYDLVMMISGQFDTFAPHDVETILRTARSVIDIHGKLILEIHPISMLRDIGNTAPTWQMNKTGLFSNEPHLLLKESFWLECGKTALERYFVLTSGMEMELFGITTVGRSQQQLGTLLENNRFEIENWHEVWPHGLMSPDGFHVIVARPV